MMIDILFVEDDTTIAMGVEYLLKQEGFGVALTPGGLLRMLRYESLFYGLTALFYGLPVGIALSLLIYLQFSQVSYFSFSLPWEAILVCVAAVLLILFATMMVSAAMIRNDNIVDTIKEENL
jgi:putative ABC transport system permease protein